MKKLQVSDFVVVCDGFFQPANRAATSGCARQSRTVSALLKGRARGESGGLCEQRSFYLGQHPLGRRCCVVVGFSIRAMSFFSRSD